MTEQSESRAVRVLREIVESGRPLLYVRSAEEQRVTALLREVASRLFSPPAPVWIWTITEGMRRDGSAGDAKTVAPRAALEFVATHKGPGVFLLNDFHEPMREGPDIRRRLRDLYGIGLAQRKLVVIASAVKLIPDEIERNIVYLDLAVPDLLELVAFLRTESEAIKAGGATVDTSEATIFQLGRALQ